VVVTAERGPDSRERLAAAASVLERGQLQLRPLPTLADAAAALPGLHIVSTHGSGIAPASISRGFFGAGEAEHVTLLIDGVPAGDAESGVADWRSVPTFAIERIEGLRGPGSALYGDTSLGGIVQVFTLAPTAPVARVTLGVGSFGTARGGISAGRPFGTTSVQGFGSFSRTAGFREHSRLGQGFSGVVVERANDARRWSARGSFNYSSRDEPGALSRSQVATDRAMADVLFQFDRDINRRGHAAWRYGIAHDRFTSTVLARGTARDGDRLRTLLLAPGVGDRAQRDISSGSVGISLENSLENSIPGMSGRLRFGADVSRDRVESVYRPVSDVGAAAVAATGAIAVHRWRVAGYATQFVDIASRVMLSAGVRWDGLKDQVEAGNRVSHEAWSPRAGAVMALGRGVAIFGQVSRAFKAPTLEQLFDPRPFPDFQGGTFLISSPALRPQRATNVEGGVRQSVRRLRWEVVAYRMRVLDEIDFDPRTFTYANIGRSAHDGVEAEVSAFQGEPIAFDMDYTWSRAVPDGSGRQLKNIPRHVLRSGVTLSLPAATTVHAAYIHTSGAFADDDNRVALDGRSTLDVRIAKRVSRFRLLLDLHNIGADRYEEVGYVLTDFRGGAVPYFYPAPGFSVAAGVEITLGRQ
jgi:outer membrane receptor protein involved in Fe transport